jgi:DNA-binding NtrC family response regulator
MMNPSASSPADDVRHAGSVLLVDDEEALLEIYAAILEPHFAVEMAGNAQEADVLLGQKTFKVIVADHSMPGETGLSFLARARVAFPHVQFVLVTGNMTPEMQRSAKESNLLFAFLTKPISITELLSVVQSAALAHDIRLAATK